MDRPYCSSEQPHSFTSSPRAGLLDTEQPLRGRALECAERLALSLSLSPLFPSHNLATSSQHHPAHGLTFSMPAACIHFQRALCFNGQFLLIVHFTMQPTYNWFLKLHNCTMWIALHPSVTITLDDYVLWKSYPVSFKLPEASEQTVQYVCLNTESVCTKHICSTTMILPCRPTGHCTNHLSHCSLSKMLLPLCGCQYRQILKSNSKLCSNWSVVH